MMPQSSSGSSQMVLGAGLVADFLGFLSFVCLCSLIVSLHQNSDSLDDQDPF